MADFQNVEFTHEQTGLVGKSVDARYFMKIQLKEVADKLHNLRGEAEIIQHLNDRGSRTCPKLLLIGSCSGADLMREFSTHLEGNLDVAMDADYALMVTEACGFTGTIYTPDLAMAIIEQKKLGVWNGDITADDILMDKKTSCIKLVDYDQAVMLDEEYINMPNGPYFEWLDRHAKERFGKFKQDTFVYNLKGVSFDTHFSHLFQREEEGSFNIGATHLFKSQETTLDKNKIYHSFQTPDVFAEGERTLDDRVALLDRIEFAENERVLDIGCNAGLLCHYLHDRGCHVWGIDIDPSVIEGARILANILGKSGINFECHDIDNGGPIGHFDTIFLFSVIHHTSDILNNSARIAKLCNRIVIECRLKEQGAKPVGDGGWITTTVWEYDDFDDMTAGLQNLFPGFVFHKKLGQGDRDRYMIEMVRESS